MSTDELTVPAVVESLVCKAKRRYGRLLEPEDIEQVAALALERALRTYDPGRAKLTTWVYAQVWGWLRTAAREELKHRRGRAYPELLDPADHRPRSGWLSEFLETLGEDAREAAWLVGTMAVDLRVALAAMRADASAANVRQAAREVLKEWGWDRRRIDGAFLEVKEKL